MRLLLASSLSPMDLRISRLFPGLNIICCFLFTTFYRTLLRFLMLTVTNVSRKEMLPLAMVALLDFLHVKWILWQLWTFQLGGITP